MEDKNRFISRNPENADFNQYWYSPITIKTLVEEAIKQGNGNIACISTPSIYYSLPKDVQENSAVFDYDEKFKKTPQYVKYDFHQPEDIPSDYQHKFDLAIIDPPFITHDVWELYAKTVRLVLKEGGKIILSTIEENKEMMKELLNVEPQVFKPSIPHLVYQYRFYTNYESNILNKPNLEIPE